MRILVLTFYFRPDLSAGSFRATALVESLRTLIPDGSQIDVITTLPNRYPSFTAEAPMSEEQPGLSICRITLPKHKSGMVDQSKAFLHFSRASMRQVKGKSYDLVYATSGRLMTAALGAWIARKKKARLYLDIRDIFVDTIKEVLPRKASWLLMPFLSAVERRTILRADCVNLVSPGFAEYFRARYPRQRFSFFTNAVDDEFVAAAPIRTECSEDRPLTVLYAGNVGDGQGLHTIIPQLATAMEPRVRFKIIGDGGRKRILEQTLLATGVTNVELLAPVDRKDLIAAYRAADVLFLHLNDYDAFKKVLPSKIFEYAALGKPMWAGISGYAAQFVKAEVDNAAVFAPCDVRGAVTSFDKLVIQTAPRTAFLAKYSRTNISREMAEEVLAAARGDR